MTEDDNEGNSRATARHHTHGRKSHQRRRILPSQENTPAKPPKTNPISNLQPHTRIPRKLQQNRNRRTQNNLGVPRQPKTEKTTRNKRQTPINSFSYSRIFPHTSYDPKPPKQPQQHPTRQQQEYKSNASANPN